MVTPAVYPFSTSTLRHSCLTEQVASLSRGSFTVSSLAEPQSVLGRYPQTLNSPPLYHHPHAQEWQHEHSGGLSLWKGSWPSSRPRFDCSTSQRDLTKNRHVVWKQCLRSQNRQNECFHVPEWHQTDELGYKSQQELKSPYWQTRALWEPPSSNHSRSKLLEEVGSHICLHVNSGGV